MKQPGKGDDHARIICECPDRACAYWVEIPIAAYDRVRARQRWLIVAPGHEADARVVERTPTYTIIVQ